MRDLGFESTYMQSGYDDERACHSYPHRAISTIIGIPTPDTNIQSTPPRWAELLKPVYHCTQDTGRALERYPHHYP